MDFDSKSKSRRAFGYGNKYGEHSVLVKKSAEHSTHTETVDRSDNEKLINGGFSITEYEDVNHQRKSKK